MSRNLLDSHFRQENGIESFILAAEVYLSLKQSFDLTEGIEVADVYLLNNNPLLCFYIILFLLANSGNEIS